VLLLEKGEIMGSLRFLKVVGILFSALMIVLIAALAIDNYTHGNTILLMINIACIVVHAVIIGFYISE
jgi:NAD-dependent oxidoreductase involved in siderophore biosynthesis